MAGVRQLSPADVRDLLADTPDAVLLDVREPWEYDIAHLPGSTLTPFALLPLKLRDLNPEAPTVVLCHHGVRSWHAACLLEQSGFKTVFNLAGGIDAWSRELDPELPRY
ncbi:MAG: rhodanese-like domain-containing protein [Gammaproteobacteria bacterium]|nr:rhodanese-like domain-containing protein [Gammaproteobacteria bacterium]